MLKCLMLEKSQKNMISVKENILNGLNAVKNESKQ